MGQIPIDIVAIDSYDTPDELQVQIRIDDGSWNDAAYDNQSGHYVTGWNTTEGADGSHALRARAIDSGGLDATSARVDVIVDNVDELPVAAAGADRMFTDADSTGAESVTLDAGASTHDPQRTAAFAWDDRWDGHPATSLGSGEHVTVDLDLGVHVITLIVTDSLGNRDEDEVIVTVSPPADTTPPSAAWVVPAAGATIVERTVTLGATVSDTGGSGFKEIQFRAKWNGEWRVVSTIRHAGSPVGHEWDVCAAGVPDGDIELALRALDKAGNQFDSTIRTVSKRFDCAGTTEPSLTLSPNAAARGEAVDITARGYDPGEKVTVTWDQGKKAKNKKGKDKKGKKGKRAKKGAQVVTLGTGTATANGDANLTFRVPGEARLGSHRLEVVGSEGNRAAASFVVRSGAPRTASAEANPGADGAADESAAASGNPTDPTAPVDRGPDEALLPAEDAALTAGPSKRKPGKSRDRAGRDDDTTRDKNKHKIKHQKHVRASDGRAKRQRRHDGKNEIN